MAPGTGKMVAPFATYVNDTMLPDTPVAMVKVLERLGYEVIFPEEQTYCGRMLTNTGYFKEVVLTVKSYVWASGDYNYVVGSSGSCIGAMQHQHSMLAEYVRDKSLKAASEELMKRTHDFTELLIDVLGLADVGAYFPHYVTYHLTCHSVRTTHVGDRPYELLEAMWGIGLVPLPDPNQCCGFGGTFCVKNSDVSVAMGADKTYNVMSIGAKYPVTGDDACLMHTGGTMHHMSMDAKTIHLAEILAHTEGTAA